MALRIINGAEGFRMRLVIAAAATAAGCDRDAVVYTDTGSFALHLEANEIRWYSI